MTSNDLNHRESPPRGFCQNPQLGAFARMPNSGILSTPPTRGFRQHPQLGPFVRIPNPGHVPTVPMGSGNGLRLPSDRPLPRVMEEPALPSFVGEPGLPSFVDVPSPDLEDLCGTRREADFCRFLLNFTDCSGFLGRLPPSKPTVQKTPGTPGVEESSSPRKVPHVHTSNSSRGRMRAEL